MLKRYFSNVLITEVEKKFVCTNEIKRRLEMSVWTNKPSVIVLKDTYYDDEKFSLTSKDLWLRRRNDVFELKWPSKSEPETNTELFGIDFYNESTEWPDIVEQIEKVTINQNVPRYPPEETMDVVLKWLKDGSFTEFCTIQSHRTRYKMSLQSTEDIISVNIDIDDVKYNDTLSTCTYSDYCIGEIELVSSSADSTPDIALKRVFHTLGINTDTPSPRGKVLEYLFRYSPKHYETLVSVGLIGRKLSRGESNTK